MTFEGTFGVHFLPHHQGWNELTTADMVAIAEIADDGDVECIWFATRFLSRDALTLMAMLSARVRTSLGTLVANPWGRNPVDLVGSLGAIAEMLPSDRELRFGIGSGVSHSRWVERPRPLRFVRETIEILRTLLAGQTVSFDDYSVVAEYFHLAGEAELGVAFARPEAVTFWFALTGGPLGDKLAAEVADGIVLDGGTVMGLGGLRDGTVARYAAAIDAQRSAIAGAPPLRRILNLCMSVSEDREAAFDRARRHAVVAAGRGPTGHSAPSPEFSDADLSETFLVGTPDEVAEMLVECMDHAAQLNCEHIVLGVPTGPDPAEAVRLAGQVVVPAARARSGSQQQPTRKNRTR